MCMCELSEFPVREMMGVWVQIAGLYMEGAPLGKLFAVSRIS